MLTTASTMLIFFAFTNVYAAVWALIGTKEPSILMPVAIVCLIFDAATGGAAGIFNCGC